MKVFLVFGWVEYEGQYLLHVASTRELAMKRASETKKSNKDQYDRFDIEEWEVDADQLPNQG